MSILFLYDPEQVPFGKLSPLYQSLVKVGPEEASNIISYCYAGLIKPGGIRNSILNDSGKDARITALKQMAEEKNDIFYNSLETGLLEKLKKDKNAADILINTGNNNIVYESNNKDLGVIKGEGKNKVGSILMKLRKIIARERQEKIDKRLEYITNNIHYTIYTAYNTLEYKIKNGIDDLSEYLDKDPSEILSILNISQTLPAVFDRNNNLISFIPFGKTLDDIFVKYIANPKDIAKDLREIYAEEYNEQAANLQKKDILYEYFIDKALSTLPSSENYKQLYKKYKELKTKGDFNSEYDLLSNTFKDKVRDIRDLIIKLNESQALEELEDRVYTLAKNGLIDIDIKPVEFLPVKQINLDQYKKFMIDSQELAEQMKKYVEDIKKREKDEADEKELQKKKEDIAKSLIEYQKEQEKLLKIERIYMKKAKDRLLKKKSIKEDEDIEAENVFELWKYYEDKYPKLYDNIMDLKRQMRAEVLIENLARENEELIIAKRQAMPLYWGQEKDKDGKIRYIRKYIKPEDSSDIDINWDGVYEKLIEWAKKKNTPSPLRELPDLLQEEKYEDNKLYNVNESSVLSPYHQDIIEIGHFVFPNVMTYVYYNLLKSLGQIFGRDINISIFAHNLLMINPDYHSRIPENFKRVEDIEIEYNKYLNIYIENVLKTRATRSLYSKFNNDKFAKLLIVSNPRVLVYNDNNDLILGTGPLDGRNYSGLNIIGQIMTQIRTDISNKYGSVVLEDIDISPKRVSKQSQIIMNDYIMDKMRELLYVFILYSKYIKSTKIITLESVNFIINQLYYKTSSGLKIYEKSIKIPKVNKEFSNEVNQFLKKGGYKMNTDALNKLWNYIVILNELMNIEITEKDLKLNKHQKIEIIKTPIEYDEINDFVTNIEYEPKDWFIETVKEKIDEYKEEYGNICVGLGLTYTKNGKNKKTETKCMTVVSKDNLEKIYLQLLLPILNSIKDDIKYKDFYITVFSGKNNLELLRTKYVDDQKNSCQELLEDNKLSCALQAFIDIFRKLKNNKDIEFISENSIQFVSKLLSTQGNTDSLNYITIDKIKESNFADLKENAKIRDIITGKLGLNFVDKYSGVYKVSNTKPLLGILYNSKYDSCTDDQKKELKMCNKSELFPLSNTSMFVCKITVNLVKKDISLKKIYTLKYELQSNGQVNYNIDSTGDQIGIEFYPDFFKNILYKFPDDIFYGTDSLTMNYQVISTPLSVNLLSNINSLTNTSNEMARVLSFIQDSFYREDIEDKSNVDLELIKQIKGQFKEVKQPVEKKSSDSDEGEVVEEEEEDDKGYSSDEVSEKSDDDVESNESDDEDYYTDEDDE